MDTKPNNAREMSCPKCRGILTEQRFSDDLAILRCASCFGMLLDADAVDKIRNAVRADEYFDVGHPKVGRSFDAVAELRCPNCNKPMSRQSDVTQAHIRYETCHSCRKIFLDAGELIDLSQETFVEKMRSLFFPRNKDDPQQ